RSDVVADPGDRCCGPFVITVGIAEWPPEQPFDLRRRKGLGPDRVASRSVIVGERAEDTSRPPERRDRLSAISGCEQPQGHWKMPVHIVGLFANIAAVSAEQFVS